MKAFGIVIQHRPISAWSSLGDAQFGDLPVPRSELPGLAKPTGMLAAWPVARPDGGCQGGDRCGFLLGGQLTAERGAPPLMTRSRGEPF